MSASQRPKMLRDLHCANFESYSGTAFVLAAYGWEPHMGGPASHVPMASHATVALHECGCATLPSMRSQPVVALSGAGM